MQLLLASGATLASELSAGRLQAGTGTRFAHPMPSPPSEFPAWVLIIASVKAAEDISSHGGSLSDPSKSQSLTHSMLQI